MIKHVNEREVSRNDPVKIRCHRVPAQMVL